MKPVLVHFAYFLLVLSTLVLIFSIAIPPVIYTLDQDIVSSAFHTNIDAEKRLIINSSTDMLPIMQDLLDYSGPIALNIRMKDLEAARNDLDAYAKKYRNLNNLVINLEMNESEVQDFVNNTKLQDDLYRELMNSSYSLDELRRLEFRYRDKKDAMGLTTVAYQGQALKKKIQSVRDRYQVVSQKLINQSVTYNLDSTEVTKAQQEIDKFVDEVAAEKIFEPGTSQPVPIAKKVSLFITPDQGVYRHEIMYSGFAAGSGASYANVSIFLDNKPYFNVTTDDIGQYRRSVEIGQISSGIHLLSAHWGAISSDDVNLTVIPVDSTLTLNITAVMFQPVITTFGKLTTTDRYIRGAPIRLIVNNETKNEFRSGRLGNYSANMTLPEGRYLINSRFSDQSFPLNASTSPTYEVISSGTMITSIRLLGESEEQPAEWPFGLTEVLITLIIISTLGGGLWYLRRRPGSGHASDHPEPSESDERKEPRFEMKSHEKVILPDEKIIQEMTGSWLSRYQELLKEAGLSEAARSVYIGFINRISGDIQVHLPLTLTPHEVIQKIMKQPYSEVFSSFVSRYEKIRYGGVKGAKEREDFEARMEETDAALSRKTHED